MSAQVRILGIGNQFRGDDGAGLQVIAALSECLPESMLMRSDGELSSLLECLEQEGELIIIDAVSVSDGDLAAGSIVQLDPLTTQLEDTGLRSSSHAMGLAEAIEMARSLGSLTQKLRIIGIVGADFSNRQGLSEPVRLATNEVAKQLLEEFGDA